MKVASVRFSATKEQLLAAFQQSRDDEAAILIFLLQAEKEGLALAGRPAADVVAAVCRQMRISEEALQAIRETLA